LPDERLDEENDSKLSLEDEELLELDELLD